LAYQAAGPLNPAGLAASLAALVRRHEALRTTFAGGDEGEPRQVIAPAAPIPLPICDLRGLPPDERKAVAARLAEEESHRPFDLARGPLARVSLLRLDEERYDLLATIHHIVADGWSLEIFVRELSALYGAAVAARPAPLPELPVQYADFARWQRRWLGAEALAPQIDYWRRQLAGAPASLDLPTDRPRPAVERARGAQLAVPLPAGLVPALQARAREQGATLFMILFAAFAALLHRVTGEDDVLVGTPVANRNRAELENLIGFFVNTLVLRADLADDPPFAELLARVREAALGAYGHQDVPFERLVEELQPERSLARSPLFQVAFVVAAERAETLAPGLVLTPLPVDSGTAKFELTLALLEGDAGWTASLEYKTDLFDAATIRRLFGQLQTLLEGVAADPERRLSDLPLSTAADRAEPAAGRGALAPGGAEERVRIAGSRLAASGVAAALAGHPHVESAVVVKRGDLADGPALVAYVVPREGLPEVEDLRRHLQDALPVSDLPAAWVFLDRLPLTSNGRVDRRALPPPEGRLPEAGFAPPRTPVEEVLAGVWAEVLGRERLGVYDDFFELGGHSLLGIRITSRMRALFGVDLPLRRLFEAPTLAGQAALVEAARAGSAGDGPSSPPGEPLVPMAPAVRAGGLSVSSAQQRLWFAEQMMPGSATLNIPHPLLLEGPLDPPVLAAGLEEIVARHEALRTTFALVEGELRQRVSPPAPFPLNLVDLAALPAAGRLAVAQDLSEAEARRPFDLARGPLLRAVLLRLGGEEHRLLLTLHHIVADAGSTEILESEITALYVAAPLAPLPIQYADFAAWERRRLAGEAMAAPAAYWRRQLAGLPLLALPTDRPRPPRQTFVGAVESVAVEADLTAGLRALARREGVSLFMTLYAAFAALLNRYTGQEDFGLGTPVAGRNRTEVEGLIGPFVNTLVLRADLSGDPPFRDLLARARELTLAAHAHADVPFERLVEELEGERDRDRSRSPLFQVVLALAAVPTPRRFAGITLTPLAVHTATSQFDLTLYVMEEPSRLTAGIEYNTDLFAAATVGRLLGHFRRLLEAVVTNPALRLSELPVEIRPPAPPAPPALTSPALPAASAAAVPAFAVPASGDGGPAARLAERQASLAQRRARLSAQQRELLARRLQGSWPAPAASTQPASSSLVAIQPTGSLPPFFCVHPAGGDVLCFHPLSRRLGTDQPFYGLQSHGLEAGEEPFTRVEEMAGHYAGLLRRTAAGPYFLGGWSLGAAVAFETARQLAAAGEEVALLAILDGPAGLRDHPAIDEGLYEDDARWLAEIADYVRRLWAADLRISYENLAALPPEEQLARFLEELRRVHFPPAAAGPAQLRRLLAVFKANVRALRGYAPAPYPGTITLFRPQAGDSDLGWGALTPFPLAVEIVAGDHVSALAEPHVRSLAERLGACIERAMGR
ncbi:MAG TPA: condensation domain-containing protein, partial [Thermoanaerobaculia bacterium]|nr:condensation domain-containing protein [Thermoanaerobaculia bacterium]